MAEVHFCNLCDQSIPLAEIETGRSVRIGDRVLCGQCRDVVARAVPGRAGGGGAFWPAVLALLGWGAAALVWFDARSERGELQAALDGLAATSRAQGEEQSDELQRIGDALNEKLALQQSAVAALQDGQSRLEGELRTKVGDLQQSFDAWSEYPAEQERMLARLSQLEAGLSVVEDRQRAQRSTQESMRDELGRIGDRMERVAAATAQENPADSPFSPEVSGLLRKLQDDDPEVRYSTLEKLAALQDERLLPHLYPLLADPYEFTRFLAAHTFGDWDAQPAVPHLIEALLDEVGFVREAAVRSLRRVTGQNFGYDHETDAEKRRRGYEAWKTWWDANGEAFLRGDS